MIGFDYASNAIYFVTICCKNKIHYFGEIQDGSMILNAIGNIAKNQIEWLEQQYKYVLMHNFIVMPNHVHILFEIDANAIITNTYENAPVVTGRDLSQNQHESHTVGTGRDLSIKQNKNSNHTTDQNQSSNSNDESNLNDESNPVTGRDLSLRETTLKIKSVSQLIGAYKTTTSKQIHDLGNIDFAWQRSFYDHIVRQYDSYNQIFNYISQNAERWNDDILKDVEA